MHDKNTIICNCLIVQTLKVMTLNPGFPATSL